MNLLLERYSDNGESTQGVLFEIVDRERVFLNYTLEDQYQELKIKGETRIPKGAYNIEFREVLSPMTERYQKKYSWFTWHLELQQVNDFTHVYIHIGNKSTHSEGCILVQDGANNNTVEQGFNSGSTKAFKRLYQKIAHQLRSGQRVTIQIT